MPTDPNEELDVPYRAASKTPKTWDNSALRLRIGDIEVEHRSIEAELRAAVELRLDPPRTARRTRRDRRAKPQMTEW